MEFQTIAGVPIRLRLSNNSLVEVASIRDLALPADGTCGKPGDPRARKVLSVDCLQEAGFAVIDVDTVADGNNPLYLFAIGNLKLKPLQTE